MPRLRNLNMTLRYEDDLRMFPTRGARLGIAALVAAWAFFPMAVQSDFWLSVAVFAGIYAIGAIGLNLLTGFTGQVSLGHAFFVGIGAYAAAWFGGDKGWPLLLWLPMAGILGALVGGLVGPFALRLRGNYLAVISLGLIFLGLHVFENWDSVTGGVGGTAVEAPQAIGPLDFNAGIDAVGESYTRDQSWFWLVWFVVGVVALLAKNIVRTRAGRAMQAVRDRDLAAEVIGVSQFTTKVGAFALSSALAAMCGGLYGAYVQHITPDQGSLGLFLSIQFVAMIIVGGIGTIFGSILGAIFVQAIPQLVDRFSASIPFVAAIPGEGGLSEFQLNQVIFGGLIVFFLVLEPRGLAAVWLRTKAYFRSWPFSY